MFKIQNVVKSGNHLHLRNSEVVAIGSTHIVDDLSLKY